LTTWFAYPFAAVDELRACPASLRHAGGPIGGPGRA
jgi:hypothetical protein